MPQLLLLIAAGAGLILVRRYFKKEQARIAEDLRAAKEANERRNLDQCGAARAGPRDGCLPAQADSLGGSIHNFMRHSANAGIQ